jgi:hypothetical protein
VDLALLVVQEDKQNLKFYIKLFRLFWGRKFFLTINNIMDYVTRYYKNLAEDLSRRLNHLQILVEASKLKDDEMVDPETGMPVMALPDKFARSPYTPTESDKLISNAFSVPGSFQAPTPLSPRPQLGRVDFSSNLQPMTPEEDLKTFLEPEFEARNEIERNVQMSDRHPYNPRSNQDILRRIAIMKQVEREREARHPEAAKQKEAAQNEIEFMGNSRIPTGMGGIKGGLYDLLDKTFPMYNNILGMRSKRAFEKLKRNPTHPWYDPSIPKE